MFATQVEEVPVAEHVQEKGIDPFALRGRSLVRVLRGRFCFDLGLAAKCFATTVTLKEGERRGLELSLGSQLPGLKVSTSYEFERSVEYAIGDCDTIAPVMCYPDAEVLVWEIASDLLAGVWKRNEVVFVPDGRPFIAGNKVLDDPECGCAAPTASSPPPDDRISLDLDAFLTRLLATTTFAVKGPDHRIEDRSAIVSQTLLALEENMRPLQETREERFGLIDIHGHTVWFRGPESSGFRPPIVLLSTDCGASVRGRIAVPEDESDFPVLAVSPSLHAASGEIRMFLNEGGRAIEYLREGLEVRADTATAAWTSLDFSHFHHGTSGRIEVNLFNADGDHTADPLVEPFIVVAQPTAAEMTAEVF